MSLRIPEAADAKFTPFRMLEPVVPGLVKGGISGSPRRAPAFEIEI